MTNNTQSTSVHGWLIPVTMVLFLLVALLVSPIWALVAALVALTNIGRYALFVKADKTVLPELIPLIAINLFVAIALASWAVTYIFDGQ